MFLRSSLAITLACCLVHGSLRADAIVPVSYSFTEGPATFALTSTAAAGRTYQMTIIDTQLSGLVGQSISGLQWRLNNASVTNWPPVNASFTSFNIFVGPGVTPSAMSTTFASNFTASPTQVRSGALTFTALAFPSGATGTTPNTFGPTISFDSPYLYTGGHLAIEVRFTAQTGATTQSPLDGIGTADPLWGVDVSARWTSNFAGVTGANGNFLVTNLVTAAVPEPTTIAMVGITVIGLATWQYRRRVEKKRRVTVARYSRQ